MGLLSDHPVVVPVRAIQLRGVAVEFNGLVDDLVHMFGGALVFRGRPLAGPSILVDAPKLCGDRCVGHE